MVIASASALASVAVTNSRVLRGPAIRGLPFVRRTLARHLPGSRSKVLIVNCLYCTGPPHSGAGTMGTVGSKRRLRRSNAFEGVYRLIVSTLLVSYRISRARARSRIPSDTQWSARTTNQLTPMIGPTARYPNTLSLLRNNVHHERPPVRDNEGCRLVGSGQVFVNPCHGRHVPKSLPSPISSAKPARNQARGRNHAFRLRLAVSPPSLCPEMR
jgi:hypothetical protein